MRPPVVIAKHEIVPHLSVGITTYPTDDADADTLLKQADTAMYQAKQERQAQYKFFTEEMNTIAAERLVLETELQRAAADQQFVLHYQPRWDAQTKALVCTEALIRWNHPTKGILEASRFIHLLEDLDLIGSVGEWVLFEACRQAQAWVESGYKPIRMSVNISATQFRNQGLVDTVRNALKESGLDAECLELELTESMLIENTGRSVAMTHDLKAIGVSLSIDDFGSGYSSLAYLKRFPIDYLKMDQSFIHDPSSDAAIAKAIAALANSLGLKIVAEGVEQPEQAAFLEEQGCDELQGFLYGRAVPPEELEQTLRTLC